jgi:hypothetical protein
LLLVVACCCLLLFVVVCCCLLLFKEVFNIKGMGLLLIAPVSHFQSPGKDKEQTYRPLIIDHHKEMIIKWLRVVSLNYVMSCSQSLVLRYRNYLQLLYTNFSIFFATVVTH